MWVNTAMWLWATNTLWDQERDNSPTDGSRNNMGIGLSVCSTIIKAHGGEIYAKNRPEGGAIFGFALDLEEDNE